MEIVGVFWGSFAMKESKANMENSMQLMHWQAAGKLKPHIHATYALENTPLALEEMMQRKVMGKLVVTI